MNIRKLIKLFYLLQNKFYRQSLRYGVGAAIEHKNFLQSINGCKHVIDVGANKGQFALASYNELQLDRIDCFEPLEEPTQLLEKQFSHLEAFHLWKYALGTAPIIAEIHVSQKDDSSSLLPITELQDKLFPGTSEKYITSVKVERLDALLKVEEMIKPVLLKIDVQGFELEVLEGAMGVLSSISWVYVECSFLELYENQAKASDIIKFLHLQGFSFEGIYNVHYDKKGIAVQADFFFKKTDLWNI